MSAILLYKKKKIQLFPDLFKVQITSVVHFSGCKTLVKEDNKLLTQISGKK